MKVLLEFKAAKKACARARNALFSALGAGIFITSPAHARQGTQQFSRQVVIAPQPTGQELSYAWLDVSFFNAQPDAGHSNLEMSEVEMSLLFHPATLKPAAVILGVPGPTDDDRGHCIAYIASDMPSKMQKYDDREDFNSIPLSNSMPMEPAIRKEMLILLDEMLATIKDPASGQIIPEKIGAGVLRSLPPSFFKKLDGILSDPGGCNRNTFLPRQAGLALH